MMEFAAITNSGLIRDNNEDYYSVIPEQGLFIVADGMGGHAAGETASKLAVETVLACFENNGGELEERIAEAIAAANARILTAAANNSALKGMGTTFTLAAVEPAWIVTGHIGDSMAFLMDETGIYPLTNDHSVSGQLLQLGKITAAEASCHPQRHILTRALGINSHPEPEVRRHSWRTGQMLLLCSDGLTEVVSTGEIQQTVIDVGSLEDKVQRLLSLALERGAPDNVTIILARL